ncbi:hypothetical protein MXF40_19385 [Serratia marcescens]|uniref:hypothetical protein n=1 Tax=Serratia marcescens TaxID=615 RepID=UPI002DBEBE2F|nr:hypothetical protein [Serratia marcescens]MEB6083541.1 hypothetical protein [Serratia marcescens]
MKKLLLLFIPLFISGFPMGDKVNLRPAKATAVGSKICVFVDRNDMEREETILKVAIWKYGNDNYVYENHMQTRLLHWNRGSVFLASVSMILSPVKDTVLLLVRLCILMRPGLSCGNGVRRLF